MKLKVIITGSTGMVGKGALYECIDHESVESVLVLNRSPLGMQHPKISEVLASDFYRPEMFLEKLRGYNTFFFCMGTTAAGKPADEYKKITYDLTTGIAKAFLEQNPDSTFIYVSGVGTESAEKGRSTWAGVKGKTENDLMAMKFRQAFMFRPGLILPKKGIKSRTSWYNWMYTITWPLFPLFRAFPKSVTDTSRVGLAMIECAIHGYEKKIIETPDIYNLYLRQSQRKK